MIDGMFITLIQCFLRRCWGWLSKSVDDLTVVTSHDGSWVMDR